MSELKHFQFDGFKGLRGRFAMRLSGDVIEMQPLAGNAPRPEHVLKAVAQMPELVEAINAAIPTRRNLYTIDRRVGMSGAVDVRLREHRDDTWANYPIRATVHVSMYGKLNEGFRLWVGDFAVLFAHIWANDVDFSEQSLDDIYCEAVAVRHFAPEREVPALFTIEDGRVVISTRDESGFSAPASGDDELVEVLDLPEVLVKLAAE